MTKYSNRSLSHKVAFTVVVSVYSSVGFAEIDAQTPIASQRVESLKPVEIKSDVATDLRKSEFAAKVVIPRGDLLKFGDTTLSDALKRVPGVTVDGDVVRMRGLGTGYTQILIDGQPAPQGFLVDSIAPELIERIEVFRSTTAEYSSRSIAGSINIVLRKSIKSSQNEIKITAQYNLGRWLPVAALQLASGDTFFSYGISATASQVNLVRSALLEDHVFDQANQDFTHRLTTQIYDGTATSVNISPRFNWKMDSDTITWQWFLQRYERPVSWSSTEQTLLGDPSQYPNNLSTYKLNNTGQIRSDLNWTHQFNESDTLEATLGWNQQSRNSNFDFYGSDSGDILQLDRNVFSDIFDESFTSRGKYTAAIGPQHSIAIGWDGSYIQRREGRLQRDESPAGDLIYSQNQQYSAKIHQLALFGQDEWLITKQLRAYIGLRWEELQTEVSGVDFATVGNISSVISPNAQLVWKMSENSKDQIRFGLSRTYRAPATAALVPRRYTVNNNNGPTNSDTQGNPYLQPELAWGLDVAYESYFGKNAFASVSAYARRINSVITPTLFQDGNEWVNSLTNSGTASTQGVEFELKTPLRELMATSIDINLKANLVLNWSTVSSVPGPNNRLGSQTPLSANFGFDYRQSNDITIGCNYAYQGGSFAKVTSTLTTGTTPVRVLDAYALFRADAKTSIRLSVAEVLHQPRGEFSIYESDSGGSSRSISTSTSVRIGIALERKI